MRSKWIRARSDVEEYHGRKVRPIDDGYLSESHGWGCVRYRGWNHLREPEARSKGIEQSKGVTIFLGAAELAAGLG